MTFFHYFSKSRSKKSQIFEPDFIKIAIWEFFKALNLLNQLKSLPMDQFSAQSELLEASYETFLQKSRTFSNFRVLLVFLSHFYMGFAYVFSISPVWSLYIWFIFLLFKLKIGYKSDSENFKPHFHMGFAYVLSKSRVWPL